MSWRCGPFVLGACLMLGAWGRAQCTLPGAPGLGAADATFDQFFTRNGPGWTGGDSTFSLVLPDGTNLWMWSDSFIGTVDPNTRLRSSYLFTAHNSLTVQNQAAHTLTTVGYPPNTGSYFVPRNPSDWFWVGDGVVVESSPGVYEIKMVLQEWTGVFQFVGDSVATLAWPSFSILSIQPIDLPDLTIEWGAKLFLDTDGYYYLYGIKDPGTAYKLPYLARFSSIDHITEPKKWQYWNATKRKWVSGQSNATPLSGIAGITNDYSVNKLAASAGTFYLMTGMDTLNPPYPGWKYVTTYYSCSPQGPWSSRTVVYTAPESGAPGCKVGTLYTYDPRAHPEFSDGDMVLISYNVNALNSQDLVCANDYKPSFIRVAIPGLLPSSPRDR